MADKFINATALLEEMPEVPYKGSVRRILMQAPSADVQPVRHGRWIQADEQPYFRKKYHPKACSECHRRCGNPHYEFCPWCGAKIDKEDTNGTTTD